MALPAPSSAELARELLERALAAAIDAPDPAPFLAAARALRDQASAAVVVEDLDDDAGGAGAGGRIVRLA